MHDYTAEPCRASSLSASACSPFISSPSSFLHAPVPVYRSWRTTGGGNLTPAMLRCGPFFLPPHRCRWRKPTGRVQGLSLGLPRCPQLRQMFCGIPCRARCGDFRGTPQCGMPRSSFQAWCAATPASGKITSFGTTLCDGSSPRIFGRASTCTTSCWTNIRARRRRALMSFPVSHRWFSPTGFHQRSTPSLKRRSSLWSSAAVLSNGRRCGGLRGRRDLG